MQYVRTMCDALGINSSGNVSNNSEVITINGFVSSYVYALGSHQILQKVQEHQSLSFTNRW